MVYSMTRTSRRSVYAISSRLLLTLSSNVPNCLVVLTLGTVMRGVYMRVVLDGLASKV
jgi:hypothetical protein